jgi:radical SAM protein with 4Fe4S-binding SPASM domain
MIVSLDGLESYHDKNRGKGMFKKSTDFLLKAKSLGFHTEIFSIVTNQNFRQIEKFESSLSKMFGQTVSVTYHPRKPLAYLTNHPISNQKGEITGFDFLSKAQMNWLLKHKKTFPPIDLGCFQVSLMSDGNVYGCCEGTIPIGNIKDDINTIFRHLEERLTSWEKTSQNHRCAGCVYPDFVCGMKKYIQS